MTNPPPLVSAAADVLQQEGCFTSVAWAGLRPGNLPRVTDVDAGRQPAVISVMNPLSPSARPRQPPGDESVENPGPSAPVDEITRTKARRRRSAIRPPGEQPPRGLLLAERTLIESQLQQEPHR